MTPKILRSLALAAALLASLPLAAQPSPSGLEARLSAPRVKLRGAQAPALAVTLINHSKAPVHILKWHTPWAEFDSSFFVVTRNGQPVRYEGPLIKRGPPRPEDYLTLAPGASLTTSVDLSEVYDFTLPGKYQVRLETRLLDVAAGADKSRALAAVRGLAPVPLRSGSLGLTLASPRLAPPRARLLAAPKGAEKALAPGFRNCSADRISTLGTVLPAAEALAQRASDHLATLAGPTTDAAYVAWFGAYTPARFGVARHAVTQIHAALSGQAYTFHCDCTMVNVFAYVHAGQPYDVFLCGSFWNASLSGLDSQSGTLLHETSHFTVVAGTEDHVYGETEAQNLARTNPDEALTNADNFEYFAESLP